MKLEINKNVKCGSHSDSKEFISNKRRNIKEDQVDQTKFNQLNNTINLINDVTNSDSVNDREIADVIGIDVRKDKVVEDNICTQFATLFFKKPHVIMVPTKVKSFLERDLPKNYLDKIHGGNKTKENRAVAVELCLLFLSQLSSTHRHIVNGNSPEGWKYLRAEYIRQLLRINDQTYQHVKKALIQVQYKEGSILEQGFYAIGKHSYRYRLGESFRSKGFVPYELQTQIVQELFKRACLRKLKKAKDNVLCGNLMEFYKNVELPTIDEICIEGKRLIKLEYTNKKGKKLIFNNKKGPDFYSNSKELIFVENSIKVYDYLTKNGLMIPKPGSEKSGGRVVDSFTLMPSWIRNLVKINGQQIAEADYSCLHPNIAMSLYGGNSKYITHDIIAKRLIIDIKTVKMEHLSFFNKKVAQMAKSPLYNYYLTHEPTMLDVIIKEKRKSEYGYKITSRRLFKLEVEIMTEVIRILNQQNIYVGYVYDALFFDPKHSAKVKEVMDHVVIQLGVFTEAKL